MAEFAIQIFVSRVFAIFVTNALFCNFANFIQYNMQYKPRNSALLKNTAFYPKKTVVLPKLFQKVRKSQQILIS